MPNLNVFYSSIDNIEKVAKIPLIDGGNLENTLKAAWESDKSETKTEFLKAYNGFFKDTLYKWVKNESDKRNSVGSKDLPPISQMIETVNLHAKVCAMALIPELRKDNEILKSMANHGNDKTQLSNDIIAARKDSFTLHSVKKVASDRMASSYNGVKEVWKTSLVRTITDKAYDNQKLSALSRDEKLDYLCALDGYKKEMMGVETKVKGQTVIQNRKISETEIDLLDGAISALYEDLKLDKKTSIEEHLTAEYYTKQDVIAGIEKQVEDTQIVNEADKIKAQVSETVEKQVQKQNSVKDDIAAYNTIAAEVNTLVPNKSVFYSAIEKMEKTAGFKLVERDEVEAKLTSAWESDKSDSKTEFLKTYNEFFKDTLNKWAKTETEKHYHARTKEFPSYNKMIETVNANAKICAMALIPELRQGGNVLGEMTYYGNDRKRLLNEISSVTKSFSSINQSNQTAKTRQNNAYISVKEEWGKSLVRNITDSAYDKKKLGAFSRDEKIDYLCALDTYKKEMLGTDKRVDGKIVHQNRKISDKEIDLLNGAISTLYKDLNYDKGISVEENLAAEYHAQGQFLNNAEKINSQINETINNQTKKKNPIKEDLDTYKATATEVKNIQTQKERTIANQGVTDDAAVAVGDLFSMEEIKAEMAGAYGGKEEKFLDGKITDFNTKYGMAISTEKLRSSIDQLSRLMILAKEERQKFLDPENVIIVENGVATGYNAKEYFKENYEPGMGGRVIEKDGNVTRTYRSSEYFETHETASEKYVYGEYQKLYSRVYKDTCEKANEKNYAKLKQTDFATVTKDVDNLFKAALFGAGVYDNPNNKDIIDKCAFGGFTTEQLSDFAKNAKGASWSLDQKGDEAWRIQNAGAKKILGDWSKKDKDESVEESVDRVEEQLGKQIVDFKNGKCDRRTLIEYTIAGEAHLTSKFASRGTKVLNFLQYGREKSILAECRQILGLSESDSLRVALNNEYISGEKQFTNESVFNSISKAVENSLGFEAEKKNFESEHKEVRNAVNDERQKTLLEMTALGREPLSIPELDERANILNAQPRSKPIIDQPSLQINKQLQN